ncbi:4-hydroxy-3-methylbut-2-enyl diphosphate reductase [Candidatus Woesearchaeota archaeon]|nr:4-hydroxy-3-methylbut-2-enyl diphosphate reductase [Candidatus Woesearchaeota archaeon]
MVEKIILASPRGFCLGVTRAVEIVNKALDKHNGSVYVRHKIVHNEKVVNDLEDKGAVFVESLSEIPNDAVAILSAHGAPPEVETKAKAREKYYNATCPLVKKIHNQAIKFEQEGYSIIIIGKQGHQEVIGTMGYANMQVISSVEEAANIEVEHPDKIAYLTQTTLSMDDTAGIVGKLKERFPGIEHSKKGDICKATQNRQSAVKELAKLCDYIIVVGSTTSSNSKRLAETAMKSGVGRTSLVPDKTYLNDITLANTNILGITSGASVPEVLVNDVINYVQKNFGNPSVETLEYVIENTNYVLPKELR